ncbi:MAG: DUF3316 domain-containing protein [Bacteroidales bacterium]
MRFKQILLTAFTWISSCALFGQSEPVKSMFSSTSVGAGTTQIYDTYLSPLHYKGTNIQVIHERGVNLPDWGENWVFQQFFKLNFGSTKNPAQNNTTISGFIGYDGGILYNLWECGNFNLFAGASGEAKIGFVYNLRNGNNPATAKAMLNLKANLMASYELKIRDYPLYMRLHVGTPFAGVFFSPQFGQSYYEIFGLDNKDGIVKFGSFNNQQAFNSLLSMDIPVGKIALRVGYYMEYYRTHTNHLTTKIMNHNVMFGVSKTFRLIPLQTENKAALYY